MRIMLRKLLLALGVLTVTSACGGSTPPPPPTAAAVIVKAPAERVKWYLDCWQYYNDKSWTAFQNCYTEQATSELVDSNPPMVTGRTAIIDRDKMLADAFPDRKGEVVLVLNNGSHIASVAIWMGTNDGAMPGPDGKPIPATHKKAGLYLAHTIETDAAGAQGTADAVYSDDATMLVQLGLMKMPVRKVMAMSGAAPIVVIAKNDDTERANLAAFQNFADAANKHDIKAYETLLADDYRLIDITQPADMTKKQAIAAMQQYSKAFPDMRATIPTVWAAGDFVVLAGTFTGTNKGAAPAIGLAKATGKSISVRFFEILRYEGGKVKEDWTFFNGAAFATQLGMK